MLDSKLWKKLQNFEMDVAGDAFPFSKRLARDNNWSYKYALCVIEEYKKFLYLMMVSPSPMTPSDQVDQVWHLHLVYTQSYWIDLCGGVLGRELHHNPTKGGEAQSHSFKSYYAATKALYKQEFQEEPPADIWPDEKVRFGEAPFYKRVSLARYWLLPRFQIGQVFAFSLLALIITGCVSSDELFKPWDEYSSNERAIIFFLGAFIVIYVYVALIKFLRQLGILPPRKDKKDSAGGCTGCGGCFFGGDDDGSGCSGCGGCGGD